MDEILNYERNLYCDNRMDDNALEQKEMIEIGMLSQW